jgi:hypothetical protein
MNDGGEVSVTKRKKKPKIFKKCDCLKSKEELKKSKKIKKIEKEEFEKEKSRAELNKIFWK